MTEKEALDESEKLWRWLMESGLSKRDYPKWKEIRFYINSCPLCACYMQEIENRWECSVDCPLQCHNNTLYQKWSSARTIESRRDAAQKILEVITNAENRL